MRYTLTMPTINDPDGASSENSCEYWENELANSKILLYELNKAISAIINTGIQSYTLDTGQSSQTVTRANLAAIIQQRNELISQIREIELYLGIGKPGVQQVRPGF